MKKNSGKRDLTEASIVSALQKAGVDIHYAEKLPWDLTCGLEGKTYLLEVKTGKAQLTDSQREFAFKWRGHFAVVRDAKEALEALGITVAL